MNIVAQRISIVGHFSIIYDNKYRTRSQQSNPFFQMEHEGYCVQVQVQVTDWKESMVIVGGPYTSVRESKAKDFCLFP